MASKEKNIEQKLAYIVIFLTAMFFLLPFVLFGENSVITVHDNLDYMVPWYKMYHDNGLFFKFDVPTKGFSGMSTLYYSQVGFYFQSVLYMLFNDFIAYTLSYYFSVAFGCISMYILLKKILGFSPLLSLFTAIGYALLPVIPVWNIAAGTLPLIIGIFFYFAFYKDNTFSWKALLLLFFPFFSFFATFGIFILGFWFLGIIALGIKNKKINPNLLAGFIMLCIGYILTDLRLFYVMFILKTPLNRTVFDIQPTDTITQIKTFLRSIITYGVNGFYHAASFQRKIIIPAVFLVSLPLLITLIRRIRKQPGTISGKIKNVLNAADNTVKRLFMLEFIAFMFCIIATLYDSGLLNGFIKKFIPLLIGFDWGRVWIFNRVLWYLIFGTCLQLVLRINIVKLNFTDTKEEVSLPCFFPKLIAGVLICLQLGYIMVSPQYYNDPVKTWFNEIVIKSGIAEKIMPRRNFDSFISYKEFFAEDHFDEIKKDISYADEKVVAFGYHPSVLMYNGFNCIDGCNNAYPLSYMQQFRTLIAPELEINQQAREYYDSWGGRMYLYNSELSYEPTKNKNTTPVKLNIDMEIFRNDFKGVYILSRAEISNSDALGLDFVKRYYDEGSIYTIYLYKNGKENSYDKQ